MRIIKTSNQVRNSAGSVLLIVLSAISMTCAGCETHAEQKQAMHDQWQVKSSHAQIPLAREHFESGQLKEAKDILNECLAADPFMPEANLLMGKVVMEQGLTEQARNYFASVVEVDSQCDEAYYWLGVVSQKSGSLSESIGYHSKAVSLKPVELKYIHALSDAFVANGQVDKALELLSEKDKALGRSAKIKVALADIYQFEGETDKAISLYRQALIIDGDDPEVINALGYFYVAEKKWDMAIALFEKNLADKKGKELVSHLELLGKCCMSNGEYGKAMNYYNKLSVHKRDDGNVWLQMGNAALGANLSDRAMSCDERALSLKPGWSDAVVLKGCAFYLSGEYQNGISVFSRVLNDKELGGIAWIMTGRCYEKLNLMTNAKRSYDKATEIDPGSRLVSIVSRPDLTDIWAGVNKE